MLLSASSSALKVAERDLLERDFGEEWVEEMETEIKRLIAKALGA